MKRKVLIWLFYFILWQMIAMIVNQSVILPSFLDVLNRLVYILSDVSFYNHLFITLFYGFSYGLIRGCRISVFSDATIISLTRLRFTAIYCGVPDLLPIFLEYHNIIYASAIYCTLLI